jgi:hypothetical protein
MSNIGCVVSSQFVRIEPGSMLQLLYPCTRYSPDKCLLCGGTFRDHLTLWWSKHLYTAFDLHVGRTMKDGVVQRDPSGPSSKSNKKQLSRQTDFIFHRKYVTDIGQILQDKTLGEKKKSTMIKQQVMKRCASHVKNPEDLQMLMRTITADDNELVSFVVTSPVESGRVSVTLLTIRAIFLLAVENLVSFEAIDRIRIRRKEYAVLGGLAL